MIETTKHLSQQKDRQTDSAKVRTLPQPRRISKLTKDCHFHRSYVLMAVVVVAHQNTAPLLSTLHKQVVGVGVMGEPWMHSFPGCTQPNCPPRLFSFAAKHTHTHGERGSIRTAGLGAGAVTAVRHGAATKGTHFTWAAAGCTTPATGPGIQKRNTKQRSAGNSTRERVKIYG